MLLVCSFYYLVWEELERSGLIEPEGSIVLHLVIVFQSFFIMFCGFIFLTFQCRQDVAVRLHVPLVYVHALGHAGPDPPLTRMVVVVVVVVVLLLLFCAGLYRVKVFTSRPLFGRLT
jgi:hypothetical protein